MILEVCSSSYVHKYRGLSYFFTAIQSHSETKPHTFFFYFLQKITIISHGSLTLSYDINGIVISFDWNYEFKIYFPTLIF